MECQSDLSRIIDSIKENGHLADLILSSIKSYYKEGEVSSQ